MGVIVYFFPSSFVTLDGICKGFSLVKYIEKTPGRFSEDPLENSESLLCTTSHTWIHKKILWCINNVSVFTLLICGFSNQGPHQLFEDCERNGSNL